MFIFPAIDLIEGCAVRLVRGDYAQKTVYSDNPAAVAQSFAQSRCPVFTSGGFGRRKRRHHTQSGNHSGYCGKKRLENRSGRRHPLRRNHSEISGCRAYTG